MRAQAREARRLHPDPQRAASAVAEAVLGQGWLGGAQRVAATMACDGELDPAPLVAACRERGVDVYLPVMVGADGMGFSLAGADAGLPDAGLRANRFGILEPDVAPDELVGARELDVVFAPVVVFDDDGNRAGRGRGYYDRALSFLLDVPRPAKPLVVGLAYECQRVDRVPTHPGDVGLDAVVTEKGVRVFSGAAVGEKGVRVFSPALSHR